MTVRTNDQERAWTFGEFIEASYRAWGRRRAKGFVWLACQAHLVVFQGRPPFGITDGEHENGSFESNAE